MCNPLIMAGMAVASTAMQIKGNNDAAKAQAKAYNEEAQNRKTGFVLRDIDRQRELMRAQGAANAAFGASGVSGSVGSATYIQDEIVRNFSFDRFNDKYNTDNAVNSLQSSASAITKQAGTQNLVTLFNTGSQIAGMGIGDSASTSNDKAETKQKSGFNWFR